MPGDARFLKSGPKHAGAHLESTGGANEGFDTFLTNGCCGRVEGPFNGIKGVVPARRVPVLVDDFEKPISDTVVIDIDQYGLSIDRDISFVDFGFFHASVLCGICDAAIVVGCAAFHDHILKSKAEI